MTAIVPTIILAGQQTKLGPLLVVFVIAAIIGFSKLRP